jgi:hypothetical protein
MTADIIRRQIISVFQLVSAIPSIPFAIVRWLAIIVARLARTGEIFVMRNLYYPVTVARRRLYGEPLWKPIDASIGVPPPPGYEQAPPVEIPNCAICQGKIVFSELPPPALCRSCLDEINADPHEEVSK